MITIKSPTPATAHNRAVAADLITKIDVEQHACYLNSVRAMLTTDLPLVYVEGWLVLENSVPIEHGWLEYQDAVVDVSVLDQEAKDYYAVFRYNQDDIFSGRRKHWPLFLNRRRHRDQMRQAFFTIPVNHDEAVAWQYVARAVTGIGSVILTED